MRKGSRVEGPVWAGWVVLRARPIVRYITIVAGRPGSAMVPRDGRPVEYLCLLQDPLNQGCRANGIVLTDAQVRARPVRSFL